MDKNVEKIYGVYAETEDITFIMKDILDNNEDVLSTEVIGFVYGNEIDNQKVLGQYIGKLKAEFTMGKTEDYDLEEICPHCSHVNQIKWDRTSRRIKCQNCGEEILLCSLCNMDEVECSKCPYENE